MPTPRPMVALSSVLASRALTPDQMPPELRPLGRGLPRQPSNGEFTCCFGSRTHRHLDHLFAEEFSVSWLVLNLARAITTRAKDACPLEAKAAAANDGNLA